MQQSMQKRWIRLALVTACGGVLFTGLGCENAQTQADGKITKAIEEAPADVAQAAKAMELAAQNTEASGAALANARALAGQAYYEQAVAAMPDVLRAEVASAEITRQIALLAQDISANNLLLDAYKGTDPAGKAPDEPLKALAAGQADHTARVANYDKQITALDAQIKAKEGEVAGLDTRSTQASLQAATLAEKSDQANGEESLKLHKQAAAIRAEATKLAQSAADARIDLARLQRQAAELQAEKKIAADTIAALIAHARELQDGWKERQVLIQQRSASSKQIANDPQTGLAKKAKDLADAMAKADEARQTVDDLLEKAINNYKLAGNASSKLEGVIGPIVRDSKNAAAPDKPAFVRLMEVHSFMGYSVHAARAYQARGSLHASHRTLLLAQQNLIQGMIPVFQQAGLTLPPGLDARTLAQNVQAATKAANDSFTQANTIAEDMVDRGKSNEERNQGRVARVATQYALYRLSAKATHLDEAKKSLQELVPAPAEEGEGAPLTVRPFPAMPAELEEGIIKRAAGQTNQQAAPVGPKSEDSAKAGGTWRKLMGRGLGAFGGGGRQ